MSHALPWRCGASTNEADDRLGHGLDELGASFLIGAADFTHHHNNLGLRVLFELCKDIHEAHTQNRVATDTDGACLADASACQSIHDFVSHGARARDKSDRSCGEDVLRDDTDLRLVDGEQTRAVGADDFDALGALDVVGCGDHVLLWDAICDADDELNATRCALDDGLCSEARRDHDEVCICTRCIHGFLDGVKDGDGVGPAGGCPSLATLAWRHASDDLCAVG